MAQVEFRRVGLSDVVGAFRAASIDGTALLELAPATMRLTLRIHDEGTLRIREALEPLKEQWRQHRVAHDAAAPTGKAPTARSSRKYGDRGAKLYDHLAEYWTATATRILDRRRRSGKAAGELVVTLGAVTELPPSAGAYVVLELDGERTKRRRADRRRDRGAACPSSSSHSAPVTAAVDRGVLSLETIASVPTSGERSLGRTKLAVAECKRTMPRDRRARPRRGAMVAERGAPAQWYKPDELKSSGFGVWRAAVPRQRIQRRRAGAGVGARRLRPL